jgi:hypothetical protein
MEDGYSWEGIRLGDSATVFAECQTLDTRQTGQFVECHDLKLGKGPK